MINTTTPLIVSAKNLSNEIKDNLVLCSNLQNEISLIKSYAESWRLLLSYDKQEIELPQNGHLNPKSLKYDFCKRCISEFKEELIAKGETEHLFGLEKNKGLKAILGNIDQTFDGQPLCISVEERDAHLLYIYYQRSSL